MTENDTQHATNVSMDARLVGLSAQVVSFQKLMDERDKRYSERDVANKQAAQAALDSAAKAGEKTELALKEYKVASNEWRDTVKDLVGRMPSRTEVEVIVKNIDEKIGRLDRDMRAIGANAISTAGRGVGMTQMWGYIVQGLTLAMALGLGLHFGK